MEEGASTIGKDAASMPLHAAAILPSEWQVSVHPATPAQAVGLSRQSRFQTCFSEGPTWYNPSWLVGITPPLE